MILCYSGKSALGAKAIAEEAYDIRPIRRGRGDINWGVANADTLLNPDISNSTNKRVMRELFESQDVPMPKLFSYGMYGHNIKFPAVGRPDKHMKGRGFWRINNEQDLQKALRGTRKKKPATHFMEYIEAPREYRVHIFLGKSIRISEKDHTAFHEYTTIKPQHNVKHVRKAAKKAVKALGLDFGAVDILADDERCWVLECNSAPGIGGSLPRLYAKKFEQWFENQ